MYFYFHLFRLSWLFVVVVGMRTWVFSLSSFSFSLKNFRFKTLFSQGRAHSKTFPQFLPLKIFIAFSLRKDCCTGYRIMGWQVFWFLFFYPLKISVTFMLIRFQSRRPRVSYSSSSISKMFVVLPLAFLKISLCLWPLALAFRF